MRAEEHALACVHLLTMYVRVHAHVYACARQLSRARIDADSGALCTANSREVDTCVDSQYPRGCDAT